MFSTLPLLFFILLAIKWHPSNAYYFWFVGCIAAMAAQIIFYFEEYVSRFEMQKKFLETALPPDMAEWWVDQCERNLRVNIKRIPFVVFVTLTLTLFAFYFPRIGTPFLAIANCLYWIALIISWTLSFIIHRKMKRKMIDKT